MYLVEAPLECVVLGAGRCIEAYDQLRVMFMGAARTLVEPQALTGRMSTSVTYATRFVRFCLTDGAMDRSRGTAWRC